MDESTFLYILGYTVAFVAGIFITRAIFSIPKLLRLQEAQLHIIAEIAMSNNVNLEIINSIYNNYEVNPRLETKSERIERLQTEKRELDRLRKEESEKQKKSN